MEARHIRIIVVDDDPLVVHAMTIIASSAPDIEVVGSALNGHDAISAVIEHDPDVVLMDVSMPVLDGIEATRQIRSRPTPPDVIVVTNFDTNDEPLRAARAGASGFLLKSEDPRDIIDAIRAVHAGEGALSRRTAKQLMEHVGSASSADHRRAQALVASLTDREAAVARLVSKGMSNDEIARELFVSPSTVKAHMSAIQTKLNVTNRVLIAVTMTRAES